MEYMKVSEAAKKWGLSSRRVRSFCAENRIAGVVRKGNLYMIPINAVKPADERTLRSSTVASETDSFFQSINEKKRLLDSKRPIFAQSQGELERLREEFLIDFTYNSNAIEGSTLTLRETALVLQGVTIDQKPLQDHLDAVGHRDAFLYIQNIITDILTKALKLTESVIKNIHALVLMSRPEDKGTYRRIPVRIMGAYTEPVAPHFIEEKMVQLLFENEKQKKTMHPIERTALFHLKFEGIHPFIDGNGRAGRLLLNMDLMQCGYPPINIKFTDRNRYYNAFDAFYRDNDPKVMVELISMYVEERLEAYLSYLE